jgi:hypothetical protein
MFPVQLRQARACCGGDVDFSDIPGGRISRHKKFDGWGREVGVKKGVGSVKDADFP